MGSPSLPMNTATAMMPATRATCTRTHTGGHARAVCQCSHDPPPLVYCPAGHPAGAARTTVTGATGVKI